MNSSRLAATLLIAPLLLSCRTVGPNPKLVPREQDLILEAVPITLVTLEADKDGYKVLRAKRIMGSPTPTVFQDLPVLIVGHDASEKEVESASVSVLNPREGHTLGKTPERQTVLKTGTVTVRFADPKGQIRSVKITVRSGPNSDQGSTELKLPLVPDSFGIVQ